MIARVSVMSRFSLDGKVALVTGVGPGMGREFALALAEAGADVCVSARSRTLIDDVAQEIRALGRRAIAITADVSTSSAIDGLVAETAAQLGRLDIMCNHAGFGAPGLLVDTDDDAWESAMALTLNSVVYGTRAAARQMIAQGHGGTIVNTSSICGMGVFAQLSAYSTAKAGVNHFTRCMATELAPHGIRINAIAPGAFVPGWMDDITPLGRHGEPEEISPALIYLASEASSYVTGETLLVSGGACVS